MSNEDFDAFVSFILMCVISLMIFFTGFICGESGKISRRELAERGVAEYSPKTGEWQFKEEFRRKKKGN